MKCTTWHSIVGSYFAKDASYSHRYTGLGRYGRFGSWSQHSSSSALLRNRRQQQLAKFIGQKIHSQLQHHHHQGSLQQGSHGNQTPSQSFFNVMRLNRKGLMLSAMMHPGMDPLAQQQHQQQQGQLQTPGLQVRNPLLGSNTWITGEKLTSCTNTWITGEKPTSRFKDLDHR